MTLNRMTHSTAMVHDPRAIERLNRIDPDGELSRRWVRTFLSEAPGRLQGLRVAIEAGFYPATVTAAYSLKIMAGWLGGHRLSTICGNLEQAARTEEAIGCRTQLSSLEEHLPAFEASLRGFLASGAWRVELGAGATAGESLPERA